MMPEELQDMTRRATHRTNKILLSPLDDVGEPEEVNLLCYWR